MRLPCVLQQYHDHDAQLYKVYVIDDDVMVFLRPSLPNLSNASSDDSSGSAKLAYSDAISANPMSSGLRSISFDSRHEYPSLDKFLILTPITTEDPSSNEFKGIHAVASSSSSSSSIVSDIDTSSIFRERSEGEEERNGGTSFICAGNLHSLPASSNGNGSNGSALHAPKAEDADVLHTERAKSRGRHTDAATSQYVLHVDNFLAAAQEIKDEFGLSLFGFDVIVPRHQVREAYASVVSSIVIASDATHSPAPATDSASTTTLYADVQISAETSGEQALVVIDVNFFPSYKEVSDFPSRLRKYLRKAAGL